VNAKSFDHRRKVLNMCGLASSIEVTAPDRAPGHRLLINMTDDPTDGYVAVLVAGRCRAAAT
jgi:hypothetical protein